MDKGVVAVIQTESRSHAKMRLRREGRWTEALKYRTALMRGGASALQAQLMMLEKFKPLPGDVVVARPDSEWHPTWQWKKVLHDVKPIPVPVRLVRAGR